MHNLFDYFTETKNGQLIAWRLLVYILKSKAVHKTITVSFSSKASFNATLLSSANNSQYLSGGGSARSKLVRLQIYDTKSNGKTYYSIHQGNFLEFLDWDVPNRVLHKTKEH